ncbi:MAG: ribonuclease H-like domain-containing protein [Firmicutes bacterium]|nr:ribonuclease H-like domain-containing protein [Bacillota bacterium]
MKHIVEEFEEIIYESALWNFYFDGMKVGVLDIETTGLNPSRNKFVLGCIYDVQSHKLHQILAQSRAEEMQSLAEYIKLIDNLDVVLTYNGRHFDIPFIQKRMEVSRNAVNYIMRGSEDCFLPYNLDLYLVLNGYSPIKKLVPNMKQKTIENYMGFWMNRADEISGAESVDLFNHYEATGDEEAEKKILLHNNDDVRQLTKLSKAVIKSDFHKAMFALGFPVRNLIIRKIRLERDALEIKGLQRVKAMNGVSPIDYMGYSFGDYPTVSRFRKDTADFLLRLPIIRQSGMALADIRAAGLDEEEFGMYPSCGSGFLILEDGNGIRHMETNHLIKAFIEKFIDFELN